ncbi:MAG: FkbM family methyltransferase [Phenylobacterium sp.]|nr:MAG: FkbM family methyltransferase [Phenylobacterium sp.]
MSDGWVPPESLRETLKRLLAPPGPYAAYRYRRELRQGEREIHLVGWLADPRRVAIDVGANKGVYTYALLKAGCEVHAFEPNPKAFGVLDRWARRRAHLHRQALSDRSGEAVLMVPRNSRGYSNQGASLSPERLGAQAFGAVTVETLRLDDAGIDNVGFMKIDVEGFELQVLRGANETLKRDRPTLLVELEEKHTKRKLAEMVAEICAYGYRCLALAGGVLTDFEALDLAVSHDPARRPDYIFNFIFLPTSAPAAPRL